MPKRSLNPGNNDAKKIEQLNQAIEAMMARTDGRAPKVQGEIEPLVRIAAELRNLPSASFKARLKSELEGKKNMSTVAEPIASVSAVAVPRLAFKNAAKAIEFYKNAFGAREISRFEVGTSIPHAEMKIGDSSFFLTEEWPEGGRFSAETLGSSPVEMSIRVDDVDSFFAHAVASGLTVKRPLQDQFYGHRDALLTDPFGYTWNVGMVKEEMSVEEMHRRMQGLTTGPEGGRMPGAAGSKSDVSPIRPGFRMVTPYLVAENGFALLDFVGKAFGAIEVERAVTPTGVHGEVRLGDSMLMIGGGNGEKKFPSTLHPMALHVYVENVDAAFQKALAAGATLISEPRDQEYGERSATVKDAAGNFWYIATHKGESYVPRGLHTVNPYLHPLRAEPLIAFLKRAFNAEELAKYASPDGVVHHAQIRVGNSPIEMGEAQGPYQPMPAMFYLYVPDSDSLYRRALAAGAKSLHEPTDQPYGDRNSAVTDDFGNTWYIATHVKDM
ncbi:MAG TPA: VOC family protein [Candidatus Aquilonibacter sp.]|nr:VOC family protein [Candidatus Aquilonibacter sp.]